MEYLNITLSLQTKRRVCQKEVKRSYMEVNSLRE